MHPRLALLVGIIAVSTSGIFLKKCDGAHPVAIAFWRLTVASLVLLPFSFPAIVREVPAVPRRVRGRMAVAGLLLGIHFALWTEAFDYTDFATNVILLSTQPLFALIIGAAAFGERATRGHWISFAAGAGGLVAIFGGHVNLAEHASARFLTGDVLSVLSCLAIALSTALAKDLRGRFSFRVYLTLYFLAGAATLFVLGIARRVDFLAFPPEHFRWIALLVLLPTLMGHSSFNYVVKYVRLYTVNVMILFEPVLTLAFAWWFVSDEEFQRWQHGMHLGWFHLACAAAVTVGVWTGIRGDAGLSRPPPSAPERVA